jgi:hypothetical protein
MEWKDLASKISAEAPGVGALIGSMAGGPAGTVIGGTAGKAIQFLASLFGISSPNPTPEQLDAAIAADPQSGLKLRMAEMAHEKEMAELTLEKEKEDHQATRDELADTKDARAREIAMKGSNTTFYSIGWIVTLSFFAAIVLITFKPINIGTEMRDTLNMLLGYLAGNFTQVVSYFYGSSKSSADKSDMIDRLIKK